MKEILSVNTVWHRSLVELPEPGRECLGAEIIDAENEDGTRFSLVPSVFYLKAGMVVEISRGPDSELEIEGETPLTAEEKLFTAIMRPEALQEIESDGWYIFDDLNADRQLRYRKLQMPDYWCYPVMPDGITYNWVADTYA